MKFRTFYEVTLKSPMFGYLSHNVFVYKTNVYLDILSHLYGERTLHTGLSRGPFLSPRALSVRGSAGTHQLLTSDAGPLLGGRAADPQRPGVPGEGVSTLLPLDSRTTSDLDAGFPAGSRRAAPTEYGENDGDNTGAAACWPHGGHLCSAPGAQAPRPKAAPTRRDELPPTDTPTGS